MRHLLILLGLLAGVALSAPVFAEGEPNLRDLQHTTGPAHIPVRDQAAIDLPDGYQFYPEASGKTIMEKLGNRVGNTFVGLITPGRGADWFVIVEYEPSGHISDEDAKNWDADKLLNDVRQGTDAENERRRKDGGAELEVVGWAEKPHYDAVTRRLVWSIEAREKGGADGKGDIVNYRTLMLGREGYVGMTMVSPLATVGTDKFFANMLLSKLDFTQGRKYVDFDGKTDKVAEYGLAALIAGVAVKKLGLIAVMTAFLLKSAKVIGLAVVGGLAAFRRLFRRKPTADLAAASIMTVEAPKAGPQGEPRGEPTS
jgi:uncharacterized membrane-anchored protein